MMKVGDCPDSSGILHIGKRGQDGQKKGDKFTTSHSPVTS